MNKATAAVIAALALLPSAMHGDGIALDDRKGVFSGSSHGGDAAFARIGIHLSPQGPTCIHGMARYLDFVPCFSAEINGIEIAPSMLYGFSLNENGTLRLTLHDDPCEGIVIIEAPPLLCGRLYGAEEIHLCSGGVQEKCYACGRHHSSENEYDCSHDPGCLARSSYSNPCTCLPLLVRVNWDDDSGTLSEDRFAPSPCEGDDDIEGFRALGEIKGCCCDCGDIVSNLVSVAGLEASSELRLWNGTQPASSSAGAFGIEAVEASSGVGSAQICYELRDERDGSLVRTITRRVTAANMEIRPDYNDDGMIDQFDIPFRAAAGTPWQVRVRDEPYAFSIVSEAPYDSTLSVCAMPIGGITPIVRTELDGGVALQAGTWTTNSAFASANGMSLLYVDTSRGPGDMEFSGSLAFGSVHVPINDVLRIRAVDANVREKWTTTNDLSRILYDFSDVTGFIWWTISDDEDNVVSSGNSATFGPPTLPPGDYTVEVYFSDIVENGTIGYTSVAPLHVMDVRLARMFETANEANRIFNPTRKDDTTGNANAETEVVNAGTPFEERYAAPRNYLYTVGDPVTGNFNVSARFDATGAEGCTNYYCAFYQPGGQKVPGTETNVDLSAQATAFSLPAPALITNVVWELRGGLDTNGNATLDNDEATPFAIYTNSANVVKYACIKGITREQYETMLTNVHGKVYYGYDNPPSVIAYNARSLLALFYANGNDGLLHWSMRPTSISNVVINAFSNDCDCFSEWLTHNCGAPFGSNGYAQIIQYTWNQNSRLSQFLLDRTPFALKDVITDINTGTSSEIPTQTGLRLKKYYDERIKSEAESFLQTAPDGTECDFPTNGYCEASELLQYGVFVNLSSNWVPGITVSVGESDGYGGWGAAITEFVGGTDAFREYDAFGTIGKGRLLNPRYKFRVKKNDHWLGSATYDVVSIAFSCELRDLYDFNYEDGDTPASAAALQIGFGAGGTPVRNTHGRIFTHVIEMQGAYSMPFDYEIH